MFATDAEAQAWANEWFAGRTPRAHDPKLYLQPDGLWDQLLPGEDGSPPAVALMRLSWLQKRAEQLRRAPNEAARRALALPRRQELERDHPEALLSVDEVRALKRGGRVDSLRVLSISHAWATPQHPDPLGATLVAFAEQVRRERSLCPGGALDSCAAAAAWAVPCLDPGIRADMASSPRLMCLAITCCPLAVGFPQGCVCGCIPMAGQGCGRSARALPPGEFAVFFECAAAPHLPPIRPPPAPTLSRARPCPPRSAQLRQPRPKGRGGRADRRRGRLVRPRPRQDGLLVRAPADDDGLDERRAGGLERDAVWRARLDDV